MDREQRGWPTTPGRETNLSRCQDAGSEAQVSPDHGEMDDASHFHAVCPLPSRPPSPGGTPTSLESYTPGGTHTLLVPTAQGGLCPRVTACPLVSPGLAPVPFSPQSPQTPGLGSPSTAHSQHQVPIC